MNFVSDWILATAWEMETPKPYGFFHLSFALIGIAACVLGAWYLRKLGDRGNRILLVSCGVFLAICELYKQLFYYYYIGAGSYQWWIFPFQLCSVPMYLCIIAPFLKPGKVQKGMYGFMTSYNLLGGLMALIEPSGIVHPYWTLTLHAFIWHISLIFIGLYLLASRRAGVEIKDYKAATKAFLVLSAIAFSINVLLRDVSGGTVNMFFVGPSNSSLVVFKQISEWLGWYVSTALYIPTVCLGAFLVFLPFHLFAKKKKEVALLK